MLRIHEEFKVFVAMNPERYSGRNRLSLAMRNRFAEIWVSDEYGEDEKQAIVLARLDGDIEGREKLAARLVSTHDLIMQAVEVFTGGGFDSYQFSNRELFNVWTKYINRYRSGSGLREAVIRGAFYIYYDRLTTDEDRKKFMEILKNSDLKVKDAEAAQAMKAAEFTLQRDEGTEGKDYVPKGDTSRMTRTPATKTNLSRIIQAIELRDPLLLVGETGVGKTSLIRYLARLTNNNFRRFNLSSQTDKLDLIGGFKPNQEGSFEWNPGVLIEAMKGGHWLVLDEVNLAPSQIIERINSLLDDDGFLIINEHKGEKWIQAEEYDKRFGEHAARFLAEGSSKSEAEEKARREMEKDKLYRIHENFRLFATMNPAEEVGRQVFSPALMNRFRVKWIDEIPRDQIGQILTDKYGSFADRAFIDKALEVHYYMDKRSGELSKNGVCYTIRHILRWMDRIEAWAEAGGDINEAAVIEGKNIYGDGLEPEGERGVLKQELKKVLVDEFGKDYEDTDLGIEAEDGHVSFGGVRMGIKASRSEIVHGPPLKETATMKKYAKKLARAIVNNEKIMMVGLTSGGKTSLGRYLSDMTNSDFVTLDLDGQTDTAQLLGQWKPIQGTDHYEWVDGLLVKAMKEGWWILIDELNMAEPSVLERINSILDDDGYLILSEHEGERIEAHPDFRLITAMNPEHYAGREKLSSAMLNKFTQVWVPNELSEAEEVEETDHYLANARPADAFGVPPAFTERIEKYAEEVQALFQQGPVDWGAYTGMSFFGMRLAKEDGKDADEEAKGWFRKWREGRKLNSINKKLRKIEAVSKVYGGDFDMTIRPGKEWAIWWPKDPSAKPMITFPAEDLETKSVDYITGTAMHEGLHRDITWTDGFFTQSEPKRFLHNVVEDPRVNNWGMKKMPGRKVNFDALYTESYPRAGKKPMLDHEVLPHMQFGYGLIHYWYHGEEHPDIRNPRVLETLRKTREAAQEAYTTHAGVATLRVIDDKKMTVTTALEGTRTRASR